MLGVVQNPNRFGAALLITGPESLLAERAVAEFVEDEDILAMLPRISLKDLTRENYVRAR